MIRPNRSQFDQICRLCLDGTDLVNIFERHPKTQRESLSLLVRETVEMLGLVETTLSPPPLIELSESTTSLPASPLSAPLQTVEIEQHEGTSPKSPSPKPQIIPAVTLVKREYSRQPSPVSSISEAESTEQDTTPSVPVQPEPVSLPEADSSSTFLLTNVDVKVEIAHPPEHLEDADDCSEEYYEYLEPEPEDIEEEVVTDDTMHIQHEETCTADDQEESSVVQYASDIDQAEEEEAEETETENEWNTGSDIKSSQSNLTKHGKGQVCPICGQSSTCLKYHMMCHTGERPYSCKYCEKSFRTSTKLNIHVNGVHLKVRKYECEICDKKFLDAGNLRNHMVTHGGERKFVCDFEGCGKSFALQGTLTVHKKVHTQDKQFGCEFCSKTFLYKWLLVKHHRTHTGERPYECDICSKRFSTITHMHTHKKTHDPEREKQRRKRKQPVDDF
ncbi:hypothetical protein RP20_CCG013553 [Aedes albopictus]|nr:hypothetical protein RP20_CCG013553 [Aedes albopictus]